MTTQHRGTTRSGHDVPAQRGPALEHRHDVELVTTTTDAATGVRWRRVVVGDQSRLSPTRAQRQAAISARDRLLGTNPSWPAPDVVDGRLVPRNDVSDWVYSAPGMHEWRRDLVPSARALYPLQRPWSARLPSGGAIDEVTRSFFVDSLDAIGIRTRAVLMRDAVRRAAGAVQRRGTGERASWVSLACGAAVPVLDALVDLDVDAHLTLVDIDEAALAFAVELAAQAGLEEGRHVTVLQRNLVATVVARDTLVDELGEGSADVVDALGIFEYFNDSACVRLVRNAYRLLRPGGTLVVANMLSDRPEIHFNQRGIGWPKIYPRSAEEVLALVRRAGLPQDRTTISIPQDGVYAVVDTTR